MYRNLFTRSVDYLYQFLMKIPTFDSEFSPAKCFPLTYISRFTDTPMGGNFALTNHMLSSAGDIETFVDNSLAVGAGVAQRTSTLVT